MDTAREGNPYDAVAGEGFGTGGKFRRRPFRRTANTTPYDRPPTALRNPSIVNHNNNGNGWLSRLVDPAQRLIASSAHRLFSSVFRKRLPPPAQKPLESSYTSEANREVRDTEQEARDKHHEAAVIDSSGRQQGAIDRGDNSHSCSDKGGVTELEQLLKQKSFTRSEIDRLTALLHSRTVDIHIGDEDKKSEGILPEASVSHDRREEFQAPASENGIGSHLISTPLISSRVLDEDVASPAELAKAYMDCRPSKVSPLMLGIRSQGFVEDPIVISHRPFPPKSPIMPLVPRSAGRAGYTENGFMTPRSRGKYAIYSMARTPYSRVHSSSTPKGVGPIVAYDGPSSSSQAAWEQNKLSDSKQGALKRRSSVLDNDLGSVGPIRRIRHKPNLLSSRGLSFPVSGSPVSIRGTGVGPSAAQYPSSSVQKPFLFVESNKGNLTRMSTENGDSMPTTSFPPVSSKSSEMASKILQQLEKLVSPKEKSSELKLGSVRDSSPTKLSPSMLHGKALRSLETVESPKFLENGRDGNKLVTLFDTVLPDALDTTSQKQKKVEENGPLRLVAPGDRSLPMVNNIDYKAPKKDTSPSGKTADSALMNFVTHPSQKKRAFQMSAHEDYLELDDDHPDGAVPTPLVEERERVEVSVAERKANSAEAATPENPPSLFGFKRPASSVLNQKADLVTSDGPVVAEKSTGFSFPKAATTNIAVQPATAVRQSLSTSDKSAPPRELNVAPMFNFGDNIASPKEPNAASTVASFLSISSADKVPQFTFGSSSSAGESASLQFGVRSDPKPESTSSFLTVSATDSVPKIPELGGADNKNNSNAGITSRTPETVLPSAASSPTPTASIGANNSIFSNGSFASIPPSSVSSTIPPLVFNSGQNQNSSSSSTLAVTSTGSITSTSPFTSITGSSSLSASAGAAPLFSATPIFKFGSTVSSTGASPVAATSGKESEAGKTRPDTSFSNLSSNPFVGTSAANPSTGSSIFGFSAAVTSTANNQSQGSLFGAGSGSVLSAQAATAGSGVSTLSNSMPMQFSSTSSSPSFGLAGNTSFSSGSSPFASSTSAAKLFNSGAAFGLGSSEANNSSTIGGTTSSLFGSSWQSSSFNSTSSSSAGLSFPASAASVPATTSPSTGLLFTASTAAAATTTTAPQSVFAFAASAPSVAATSSSPGIFGSSIGAPSGPAYSFTSSGNNDQMNMEDSMAEDTVQASMPAVPAFSTHPVTPPQSNFVFGSTPTSTPNPFTFVGQQNSGTVPNLFQATNSLGGSFSVGAGGGDKSGRKIVKVSRKGRKK
ncbi:nuclear pore complex protein NUP1 isoform X2 [Corylus avellana]|uniref:nuclear pore complex protein NUP1 isoform X2 n=1 Tax=Corylus avellana TaxID=13451 RepID=UPI00286BB181|nr:nuclear pore complex protein NUP1 isoform X2 [Corylus avellana]